MRRVQRWRYYCDFCKKAGGSAGHMARHEQGCTANPNRVCGICKHAESNPEPLATLVEFVKSNATTHPVMTEQSEPYCTLGKEALEELRKRADGCPACMFAALRQAKTYAEERTFDFQAELQSTWSVINGARSAREDYG